MLLQGTATGPEVEGAGKATIDYGASAVERAACRRMYRRCSCERSKRGCRCERALMQRERERDGCQCERSMAWPEFEGVEAVTVVSW